MWQGLLGLTHLGSQRRATQAGGHRKLTDVGLDAPIAPCAAGLVDQQLAQHEFEMRMLESDSQCEPDNRGHHDERVFQATPPRPSETTASEATPHRAVHTAANESLHVNSPSAPAARSAVQMRWLAAARRAIPPHQLTQVCGACQTLNRDTRDLLPSLRAQAVATHRRRAGRGASDQANARRALQPSLDGWPPVSAKRRPGSRRVLGIPVPAGVDVSIVWLLIGLALLHVMFAYMDASRVASEFLKF